MTNNAEQSRDKFRFDKSVNLTHVVSVVMLMASGTGLYINLDKRTAVLEATAIYAVQHQVEQQELQKESNKEIKSDIKEIQRSLNEISKAVAAGRK